MAYSPSIICPVDFSDHSRGALRYAATIAEHFGARLTVLTVDDPLLASVAASAGFEPSLAGETERELRRFLHDSVGDDFPRASTLDVKVAIGKPASEILRVARDAAAELIVMSSHGRSGVGKHFFGSTTERVLRSTDIPVLITPQDGHRMASLSDAALHVRRVIAPVDLSAASHHQLA